MDDAINLDPFKEGTASCLKLQLSRARREIISIVFCFVLLGFFETAASKQ